MQDESTQPSNEDQMQIDMENKLIIDVNDRMKTRGLTTSLHNKDPVVDREHLLFDRIKFRGIDRHQMP